ncbi:ATP-binding cassette domain-containing protein [Paenibacillus mendelii]|uniref:ATP-binding cassette domain-containing protein n=1 Tax=Paenibacillus mendelii TaxID=206163 RepID=A0ABV6JBI8_9BACL|nr:ABC transporter ATP-binding protein [Paenibacillus mendelii]MCQ6559599.1 ABC transporter ATP-binding protein [Paenibacillus mendelii]
MLELHKVQWRRGGSDFRLFVPRLVLKPGITLLVGRNGAGKSSLLQLLATAQFPTEGEIRYDGLTVDRDLPSIRSQIGFVPTGIELYEQMKTVKLLHYLAELKGGAAQGELEQLMEAFHLTAYRTSKIKTLAQGVRQRIALAQAWIASPAYIFLDEPLNALDSLERLHFTRFAASHSRGRTIIISTHELNEWEAWADRVLWVDEGKPQYHGTIREWSEGLSLSVWSGTIDADTYRLLDPARILTVRPEGDSFQVRILGSEVPPSPQFEKQPVTTEDAYYIRCRSITQPGNVR